MITGEFWPSVTFDRGGSRRQEVIPYFANLARARRRFEDPVIIPGHRVTHLSYAVQRTAPSGA